MKYTLDHIASIIGALKGAAPLPVEHLLLDSRKVFAPAQSLFFALKGPRRDGHQFIPELYQQGVRSFVVSENIDRDKFPGAEFLLVDDTLAALQQLATHHRKQFKIPVIGITGSNGKTIVKEWLYQLLQEDYNIVRSPRSYNSQTGVPLSVWQMNEQHNLAIFEAGISMPGEMIRLEKIIHPTIGVFTNIGEAHSEGFSSQEQKLVEKLILFTQAKVVIGRQNYLSKRLLLNLSFKPELITWGDSSTNRLQVMTIDKKDNNTTIIFRENNIENRFVIPFRDDAAIENAITCYLTCLYLGLSHDVISRRMQNLQSVSMRMEVKNGINNCTIINDSYSADLSSLDIALNFLSQKGAMGKKTVILSDMVQTGVEDVRLYLEVWSELKKHGVSRLIGIGDRIRNVVKEYLQEEDGISVETYLNTEEFVNHFRSSQFRDETILVKGARVFAFEQIVHMLEQKVHQTILEINLNAIASNLRIFQQHLEPTTKLMAMVKAFAYGSGGAEIANVLQYHKVDYLGVAYADEGVELRKAGITLPIMVLNPEETTFEALVEYNLEPDIYSFELLELFDQYLKREGIQNYPVHIEIETGMNRLGFDTAMIDQLSSHLNGTKSFIVRSAFTHLASGEDPNDDEFTLLQHKRFSEAASKLESGIGYPFLKHISNSAAILRHPSLQMDMVRLGIGMYGVNSTANNLPGLQPVATLKSNIAQLKHLKAGESVSYNRKGVVKRDSIIATVRIGYADGFSRRLGNGNGKIWIKGKLAPVIGTVCMDMTMIDVTGIEGIREGDEVIVFGKEIPIEQLAEWAGTIPYEIMTGISQRVKRVYFEE